MENIFFSLTFWRIVAHHFLIQKAYTKYALRIPSQARKDSWLFWVYEFGGSSQFIADEFLLKFKMVLGHEVNLPLRPLQKEAHIKLKQ